MTLLNSLNMDKNITDKDTSLASVSMRESFFNWITENNAKKYPPEVILSCLDRISEYAIRKKISSNSIWEYTQLSAFQFMYEKLLGAKFLRITDSNTYKIFIVAGKLYMRFLKEKPFARKTTVVTAAENIGIESTIISEPLLKGAIDPETVIAWLITQPNTNGTLYLENVVRHYMGALRTAPTKLEIPVNVDIRDVFACHTPDELTSYWNICKAAPNYKQVNSRTSGMFSAGMGCYLRYLEHLERGGSRDVTFVKSSTLAKTEESKLENDNRPITFISEANIDKDTSEAINQVLSEKFTNGFRYSNGIELGRLRRFTKERLGKEVILDDDEIVSYVRAQGTEFASKIYVISKDTKEHIYLLAKDYFQCGATAIFYAEFYARHESWLFEASIISEEMLIEVLREEFRNFNFTQTYFGQIYDSVYNVLQSEILRVWGDEILLTYETLAKRLVYIPQFRIEQHLGQNNDFIWNSKGEFTYISKVDIADHEKREIANYIESKTHTHGYVSISDVSLDEISDRNYELSITAIHNAVYFICLADKYAKSGKIITRKSDNIDALHITKEHCKTLERCTLDDLLNFERNLTGECHRWIPMQAGYDVLVRTDENVYVADRYIHFDTVAIDAAIEYFLHGGEYTPLKSVTTFAMLPHCGQAWNLFLLESYCRRFSDDFRFECLSVNSKNAGAIVRKKSRLSYADILADAVAKSDVSLIEQPVLNFLVENGYISTRRYTKVTELINQAKAIRNK